LPKEIEREEKYPGFLPYPTNIPHFASVYIASEVNKGI
jgi:hypothetical protein